MKQKIRLGIILAAMVIIIIQLLTRDLSWTNDPLGYIGVFAMVLLIIAMYISFKHNVRKNLK